MATIRVLRGETDGETFPDMCVRCGEPADERTRQTFAWMPGWVHILLFLGLLPWLLAACFTRKTMTVDVPVCDRHRNHWLFRKLYVGLGLAFWVAAAIGLAVVMDDVPKELATGLIAAMVFGGLLWLIVGVVLVTKAVRAAEIRETGIELANVSKDFAMAWHGVDRRRDRRAHDPEPEEPRNEAQPWLRGRRG